MSPRTKKVFLSSHPYFNNGDPSLPENLRAKVSVFKILPTSINPKEINIEVTKNI
jgi:hypothetical protein